MSMFFLWLLATLDGWNSIFLAFSTGSFILVIVTLLGRLMLLHGQDEDNLSAIKEHV